VLKKSRISIEFGGLAQMVERSLSMREVLGSMPRFSNLFDFVLPLVVAVVLLRVLV
jgi:hypothetical protein